MAELPDIFSCPTIYPYNYFDKTSECHQNEKELYDVIVMGAYNNYGVHVKYYVNDYNTSYDVLFGEDRDRTITRTFSATTYYELPKEEEVISMYGIEGLDLFEVYINIMHFAFVSTFSGDTSGVYPAHEPLAGDLMQAEYNGKYYEIMDVKDTTEQFLQGQHTWRMIVREYRDLHFNLSATTSADNISGYVDQSDMFDISNDINTLKTAIIITSADDVINGKDVPDDPFGGW